MVVEELVKINVNPTSRKHFISKGYDVPKCSFRNIKPNEIEVKTTDLMPSSHIEVKRKCDECGKIDIVQFRNSNRPCYDCAMKIRTKNNEYVFSSEYRDYCIYKHQAKKRGYVFELTIEQFKQLCLEPCHYCGDFFVGIDRKDNSIGYVYSNCVPCCKHCNYAKRDMKYTVFISHIRKMYEHTKTVCVD